MNIQPAISAIIAIQWSDENNQPRSSEAMQQIFSDAINNYHSLNSEHQATLCHLYKMIGQTDCMQRTAWIEPFHIFQSLFPIPIFQKTPSDPMTQLVEWLSRAKGETTEALRRIKLFSLGEIPSLDLSNLNLSKLPNFLFTDPRFACANIEKNPLVIKELARGVKIINLCNQELFKQAYKIAAQQMRFLELPTGTFPQITSFLKEPQWITDPRIQQEIYWNIALCGAFKERFQKMVEDNRFPEYVLDDFEGRTIKDLLATPPNQATEGYLVKLVRWMTHIAKKREYLNDNLQLLFECLIKPEELKDLFTKACAENLTHHSNSNLKGDSVLSEYFERHPEVCDRYHTLQFTGNFHSMPREINLFRQLETLKIFHVNFNHSLSQIGKLEKLTTLVFWSVEIGYFPKEILDLNKTLKRLLLVNCNIRSVPPEINRLNLLEFLELSANNLQVLPREIGDLVQLQKLDVSRNSISSLPSTLNQLTHLNEFIINKTSIPLKETKGELYYINLKYSIPSIRNIYEKSCLKLDLKYKSQLRTNDPRKIWNIRARIGAFFSGATIDQYAEFFKKIPAITIHEEIAYITFNRIPAWQLLKLKAELPECQIFYHDPLSR